MRLFIHSSQQKGAGSSLVLVATMYSKKSKGQVGVAVARVLALGVGAAFFFAPLGGMVIARGEERE